MGGGDGLVDLVGGSGALVDLDFSGGGLVVLVVGGGGGGLVDLVRGGNGAVDLVGGGGLVDLSGGDRGGILIDLVAVIVYWWEVFFRELFSNVQFMSFFMCGNFGTSNLVIRSVSLHFSLNKPVIGHSICKCVCVCVCANSVFPKELYRRKQTLHEAPPPSNLSKYPLTPKRKAI